MLCQKCQKNNATVKIVKNYNGHITEQYLCQSCAGGEELTFSDFSKDNLFSDLLGVFSPVSNSDYVCDKCHTSYKEFKQNGKFGCEECFNKFKNYIDKLFKSIHSSSIHSGKLPKRCGEHLKSERQKAELKAELQKAIQEENYEEAARIRDIIKGMEG